jgi:hypothetical protein
MPCDSDDMMSADWFPNDEPLRDHELMAMRFLSANGPHAIGIIDDDDKFAAAFTFKALAHKGMVVAGIGDNGPTYRLTKRGSAAIAKNPFGSKGR